MGRYIHLLFLLIAFQANAQKDSLSKYTTEQLSLKSSMATSQRDKPMLWKVYMDAMMNRNPSDSLKCERYYNLAWELYSHTDSNLEVSINTMNLAIYYGKRANSIQDLIYCYDSLGAFYAIKNDNSNALQCLEEIKKLHHPDSDENLADLKFNTSRIYSWIGDFERATSILLKANKNIDSYLSNHPKLSKEIATGLTHDKKLNYIKLVECYNFQKKLDSSAFYIKKIHEINKKGIHNRYDWIGEAFYLVLSKKYDLAIDYIADAEKKGNIDTNDKRYRAYYFLALCWEQKNDYAKSLALCEKALSIHIKVASFLNYELEIYNLATSNASKLGNKKKEDFYSKKFNACAKELDYAEKSRFISKLYQQDVVEVKRQLQSEKARASYYYIGGILVFVLIGSSVIYIKSRRDRKKFKNTTVAFETKIDSRQELADKAIEIETRQILPLSISDEIDKKIVKHLLNFEKKQLFLLPTVSLSAMAKDFSTNPGYLSATIKKHKTTNFNGYINDLRIDYIVLKLKTSPKYSSYKIAYLAEECGFASYSVFHRIFIEKTGVSPSAFISQLRAEES